MDEDLELDEELDEDLDGELEPEEQELIDSLIDRLNDGVAGVTFDRDALETDRPDDWGAVELIGEEDSDWGDGTMVDQALAIDIWVCVSHRGSRLKRQVQAVLKAFAADTGAGWRLMSRNYIYDLDKVVWRWRVSVFAPLDSGDGDTDRLPFGGDG